MTVEKVYRAGMIPYFFDEDGCIKMMFMQPTNTEWSGSEFQLAKGRVDPGEQHIDTAIREAKEELGLFEGNIDSGPHHVGRYMGRTDVYVCRVFDPQMFGEAADETAAIRWMGIEEFLNEGRPLHRPVVQECYREICRIEGVEPEIQLARRY